MNTALITDAIEAVQAAVLAHESEIESLDRAIGDGDHFVNLKRGLSTLSAMREALLPLAPDAALQKMGMKLLSTIGGASGPQCGPSKPAARSSSHRRRATTRCFCGAEPPRPQ